jgi:putative transposase
MGVSPSGYYGWCDRPQSDRAREEAVMVTHIRAAHEESRGRYGSPRVYKALQSQDVSIGVNRVARLMRKHGIAARKRRRFRRTTIVNPMDQWFKDAVNRIFNPEAPNTVWAADITYIETGEGWMYLAVVLDLYSRRVVGWAAQAYMTTDLVAEALVAAIEWRRPPIGLIHHSDRGTQYASKAYKELLQIHGMVGSMSDKGDCWDNAPVESFFSTLKKEIDDLSTMTHQQAWQTLFEFIEIWYNRQRLHSSLGYVSPAQYEVGIIQASKA